MEILAGKIVRATVRFEGSGTSQKQLYIIRQLATARRVVQYKMILKMGVTG
jgi:hypothetical protein